MIVHVATVTVFSWWELPKRLRKLEAEAQKVGLKIIRLSGVSARFVGGARAGKRQIEVEVPYQLEEESEIPALDLLAKSE